MPRRSARLAKKRGTKRRRTELEESESEKDTNLDTSAAADHESEAFNPSSCDNDSDDDLHGDHFEELEKYKFPNSKEPPPKKMKIDSFVSQIQQETRTKNKHCIPHRRRILNQSKSTANNPIHPGTRSSISTAYGQSIFVRST